LREYVIKPKLRVTLKLHRYEYASTQDIQVNYQQGKR
jgi:hypothetical protein